MNQSLPQGSILHHLAAHALANPAATVFTVLRNGEEMEQQVSYTQLWQAVQSLSASLDRQQLEGKTALLIYQEVVPFIVALLACQLSGIVPVPVSYVKGKNRSPAYGPLWKMRKLLPYVVVHILWTHCSKAWLDQIYRCRCWYYPPIH